MIRVERRSLRSPGCAVLLLAAALWLGGGLASRTMAYAPPELDRILERQAQVAHALARVAQRMDPNDPTEERIRSVVHALSVSEAAKAVDALGRIARAPDAEAAETPVIELIESQDRIIETIEKILGILARLEEQAKDPPPSEKGSDLSDIEKEKYEELLNQLEEFLKQQKKVIESTTSLAKMHVEDFTPEQEEELKQLAATEDEWARFLRDTVSDLSKLPEQDFSNPELLKELVEIYTEIEMAADALEKKTVELAVPMEGAAAELAEELVHNLERWLMDEPDRIRWQMEEPLQDYEIPMAELPEELQDIVGELMEQEEDLMSDIEDATSAWADSLDEGAGWTAMDGPISNYSAKGVTGNMMPNSSEIGGRSGEGRTGKSGGQYVEESAVGKGGRKTPTCLTPDPFEAGVVDDRSPDPATGSTGGGKISGAGGEGLEGPVPPQLSQEMQRLAGRQAEIRNEAERVRATFTAMEYPSEPLQASIRRMEEMESALKNGRVDHVVRLKRVMLSDLEETQAFLEGETRVRRDSTVNLPPELQDEILDAMEDPSPKPYEDLLRAYFEALARAPQP